MIQRVLFLANFLFGTTIRIPDNVGNEQSLIITVTRSMQKRSKEALSQVSHSYVSFRSTKFWNTEVLNNTFSFSTMFAFCLTVLLTIFHLGFDDHPVLSFASLISAWDFLFNTCRGASQTHVSMGSGMYCRGIQL